MQTSKRVVMSNVIGWRGRSEGLLLRETESDGKEEKREKSEGINKDKLNKEERRYRTHCRKRMSIVQLLALPLVSRSTEQNVRGKYI